jgi:hypothetical protein
MYSDGRCCQTRYALEKRIWKSVSELHALTSRLLSLTRRDHQGFIFAKGDCVKARAEISKSRRELELHRLEHEC